MSDPQIDLKRWFHEKTEPHGIKTKLAEATGYTPTQISRMRNYATDDPKKRQEIPLEMIAKAARFFGELPPGFEGMTQWIEGAEAPSPSEHSIIPLMGFVGAGAEVEPDFEQVPPEGLDQIEVPIQLPDDMLAWQVKGDSMLPMFEDGMVIVTWKEQRKPIESFYGQRAIVRTADGRRFIKTIIRGDRGSVSLLSWNARPIENVEVDWIGEIFTYFPEAAIRSVAKQSARQGGVQGRLRLVDGDPTPPKQLKAANFNRISQERFDELVTLLLDRDFTEHRAVRGPNDTGIDAIARDAISGGQAIVTTKRTERPIGKVELTAFLGTLSKADAEVGFFVTSGAFTVEAKKLAEGKPIVLVDGEDLLAMADRNRQVIPDEVEAQLVA